VGIFGPAFGAADVNIAGLQIARKGRRGSSALAVITVDDPVDPALLDSLRADIQADVMREIDVVID
jgi:D-3-phosphoglycerate dehydrogenase